MGLVICFIFTACDDDDDDEGLLLCLEEKNEGDLSSLHLRGTLAEAG